MITKFLEQASDIINDKSEPTTAEIKFLANRAKEEMEKGKDFIAQAQKLRQQLEATQANIVANRAIVQNYCNDMALLLEEDYHNNTPMAADAK